MSNTQPLGEMQPSWLRNELLKQAITGLVRHLLAWVGTTLAALGWVAPDKFETWEAAHYAEMVGFVLMGLALAWSWLRSHDLLALLRGAIQADPYQADGSPTQIQHVKQSVARRPVLRRVAPLLMCLVLVLSTNACFFFGGVTPTQKFARGNKEIQVYIQEADKVINALTETNPPLLAIDTAIEITLTLRSLNQAQKELLLESVKYLQVNEQGEEVLVIDQAGRLRLMDLTQSLFSIATRVINNPAIFKMSSADRIRLTAVLTSLQPLVVELQKLIGKFKTIKPQQEQLRLLVPAGTRTSLLDLIKGNDGLAVELGR